MKKKLYKINKQSMQKAVSDSSAIEELSLARAKKNKSVINMLKKHGRGFSI